MSSVRRSSRAKNETNYKEPTAEEMNVDLVILPSKSKKKKSGSPKKKKSEGNGATDADTSANLDIDMDQGVEGSQVSNNEGTDDDDSETRRRSKRTRTRSSSNVDNLDKPPAARPNALRANSSKRRSIEGMTQSSESDHEEAYTEEVFSDSEEDEDSEGGDSEEDLQIQRIIACRTTTVKEWKDIMSKMNTTEVIGGTRLVDPDDPDAASPFDGKDDEEEEERFLVKWTDVGFLHCSWETKEELLSEVNNARAYIATFNRKNIDGYLFDIDERADGEYFDPAYIQIDRILEVDLPEKQDDRETPTEDNNWGMVMDPKDEGYDKATGRQFLVKWCNVSYDEMSYEFERDLITNDIEYLKSLQKFEERNKKPTKKDMKTKSKKQEYNSRKLYKIFGDRIAESEEKSGKIAEYKKELEETVFDNGGQLRDYQAEGVSWLLSNYINDRSSILADEMGLGKTVQTAIYINTAATYLHKWGPILIVAPLSTIPHWQREFTGWTNLNTIVYHGSLKDRELIRSFEFAYEADRPSNASSQRFLHKCHKKKYADWERTWMVDVVITTPEMLVCDDFTELMAIKWEILVVDEAHRLKNHSSKLAVNLRDDRFDFGSTLLLTGTPIQNNMKELWTLMNIINPEEFGDCDDFLEKYENMKTKESVDSLHESIQPYMLRRLKEDVEKKVPPKEETLIEVELTVLQKQYYRALYEKNVQFLHRNKKKALDGPSLNNLAMQLRKCCNHPFLLNGVEDEVKKSSKETEADFLVKTSGKLVLLDKLLPKLKEGGHRILIFSQFKIMLDILEDYLDLREFKHERIDGSITGSKRQMAIDRFQAKESLDSSFIMLLSTRAGGVGINLTAADTCIIYDSDWNPQNDLQAQARCHRIGQTKSVKVYRLLSRKSYEMQMFHMSSLKMGLDQAVLQGIENNSDSASSGMSKDEIEKLLRHGAYEIFTEEKLDASEKESKEFIDQDIDSILARRTKTVVHENTGSQSSAVGGTFSKASFTASKTNNVADDVDIDDPDFWKKMVGEGNLNDEVEQSAKKSRRTKMKIKNYSDELIMRDELSTSSDDEKDDSDSDDSAFEPQDDFEFMFGSSPDDINLILHKGYPAMRNLVDIATRARQTPERVAWEGELETEWSKNDATLLVDLLQKFGLYTKDFNTCLNQFKSLSSKKYSDLEVKRMCFSVFLLTVSEVIDEDFNNAIKRAERNAAKGKQQSSDSTPEPIDEEWRDKQLSVSFQKIWSANAVLGSKALQAGLQYIQKALPRVETHMLFTDMKNLFNESILPRLVERGWKDEGRNGEKATFTYVKDGKKQEYMSAAEVINAGMAWHPELSPLIGDYIVQSSELLMSNSPDIQRKDLLKHIGPTTMSMATLKRFLDYYAPAQLLSDRQSPRKKVLLNKKLLEIFKYLYNAHDLVSRGYISPVTSRERYESIARYIQVRKSANSPHPKWEPVHDAILVEAISKHGWIENEIHYKAIIEDTGIKWEPPFGKVDIEQTKEIPYNKDEHINVAKRVEMFFNNDYDDFKDSNEIVNYDLLMKSYGISVNMTEGTKWRMDPSKIILSANEILELPEKTSLVKRAKVVLSKSSIASRPTIDDRNSIEEVKSNSKYGFTVLEQRNVSNLFLVELLSAALKGAKKERVSVTVNLLSKVMNEVQMRCESKHTTASERKELENINKHVSHVRSYSKPVSREAKNILRVILGLDPYPSFTGDSLFISTQTSTVESFSSGALEKRSKKKFFNDSASGDMALNKAFVIAKYNDQPSAGSEVDHLKISEIEALILSTLCSQGFPIYGDEWTHLGEKESTSGSSTSITWTSMGRILEVAATQWLEVTKQKVAVDPELSKYIECKEFNLIQAKRLHQDPILLAKKTVMLMESIRLYALQQNEQKKRASTKNHGPGPFVLQWKRNHIFEWAKALDIVQGDEVIACSESQFITNNYDKPIALLDRSSSRDILNQISQLTRLRSIYLGRTGEEFSTMLSKAVKSVERQGSNTWKTRPKWWKPESDDHELVEGLLQFGYGGFDEIITNSSFCSKIEKEELSQDEYGEAVPSEFTRLSAQHRIDNVIKELNNLDDIERNHNISKEARLLKNAEGSINNGAVQTGIASFFTQANKSENKPSSKPSSAVENGNGRDQEGVVIIASDSEETSSQHFDKADSDNDIEIVKVVSHSSMTSESTANIKQSDSKRKSTDSKVDDLDSPAKKSRA